MDIQDAAETSGEEGEIMGKELKFCKHCGNEIDLFRDKYYHVRAFGWLGNGRRYFQLELYCEGFATGAAPKTVG
jgi:hypothetical protein